MPVVNAKKQISLPLDRKRNIPTYMPLLVDKGVEGVLVGQRSGSPLPLISDFLDRGHYFFIQVDPHLCSRD
jgi:hypothetical protein